MKKLGVECGKNKKGITLVALIVTIVVLLILAGVKFEAISWEQWNNNSCKTGPNKQ